MTARMEVTCAEFNAAHPVGTVMHAWTGAMGEGPPKVGTVREPGAYILGGHTPVVFLDGVRGCVALTHVRKGVP